MQILARIPVLATGDEPPESPTAPPAPPVDAAAPVVATAPAVERDEPVTETSVAALERAEQSASSPERPRRARLPAPSILVLSILALAMWMAALRNDRLRLEAARQARAERMAQVVPEAGGLRGSRTR